MPNLQHLNNTARITDGDCAGRDVLGDNRAGTDGDIIPDRHSWKDSYAASDPHIIADGHWLRPFLARIALHRVCTMTSCVNADIRAYEAVVTDCDRRFIQNRKMEIGKESFADRDLLAVITVERLIDDDRIITDVPQKPFKQLQSAGIVKR